MAGFWREHIVKRLKRSPEWPAVRKAFMNISGNNVCAVCEKKRNLQVHHIIPFSISPGRELDPSNLITLCDKHHLIFGHLGWFQSWNPDVVKDCEYFNRKIKNRPTKAKKKAWNERFWAMFK